MSLTSTITKTSSTYSSVRPARSSHFTPTMMYPSASPTHSTTPETPPPHLHTPTKSTATIRISASRVSDPTPTTTGGKPPFHTFILQNRPSSMFAMCRQKSLPAEAPTLIKAADEIDPADGKTRTCDRAMTFETFVQGGQLRADLGETEEVGTGNDVKKGLGRVRGWFGKKKGDGGR